MPVQQISEPFTIEDWVQVQQTHAALSSYDLRFREHARRDPECLNRSTFRDLDRENSLLNYNRQPWPTFISARRVQEFERLSVAISELIRGIPQTIFDNDAAKIARYFGVNEAFTQIMLEPPNGIAGALSRGDFIETPAGFRCIEFNMTSSLGGWETGLLVRMLLQVPPIRRFIEQIDRQVVYRNTLRILLKHVLREVYEKGLAARGEVNIAVSAPDGDAAASAKIPEIVEFLNFEYAAALRESGLGLHGRLLACGYAELTERDGFIYYEKTRLHAIVERHVNSTRPLVFRSFKAGNTLLYNGPMSWVLSDKRNLALLSENEESDAFTAEERRIIQEHVPWTRRTVPGKTTYRGEEVDLEHFVVAHRENLVLKKARSLGGADVVIGRFSTPEAWQAALAGVLQTGDWLVQEYLESKPYLFQAGDYGCCPHDAVWGPFVFGDTYAGTILRVQPKEWKGIVNLTRGATEGILLEVEDPAAGHPPPGGGSTGRTSGPSES